jgi:ribosomal protein S18 acetylase RimI-like enzyme
MITSAIHIEPVLPAQISELRQLSIVTFTQTFASHNAPEDMESYLSASFSLSQLLNELKHPHSAFFFALYHGAPAGYLKLNWLDAQTHLAGKYGLEIERIYVLQQFKAQGIGSTIMNYALKHARAMHKNHIWLGVWEHNTAAIAFYQRYGFIKTGTHPFTLGSDVQTDWIMQLNLLAETNQ